MSGKSPPAMAVPVPAHSSAPAADEPVANPPRRRVQMVDIARMAGVSSSTVSRALSGSPLIPTPTRERIVELARSLNYRVNVGAANLRKRDLQTVGVVVLGDSMQMISDPFILGLIGAVADALDERGMNLLLTRLGKGRRQQIPSLFDGGQVAGLIVIGQYTWHEYLNQLAQRGVPMAVWGAPLPDAAYPVVGGDNAAGGHAATAHLLQQGARRIAFFGDASHPETGLRYQGHVQALTEWGLQPDPGLYRPFLFDEAKMRQAVHGWLDEKRDFDAIFAASDIAAIALIAALSERGVAVPQQVRVVGYDDIPLSAHLHPAVSSVCQPIPLAGQALVELLFEAIAQQPRRSVILPTELRVRDSSL